MMWVIGVDPTVFFPYKCSVFKSVTDAQTKKANNHWVYIYIP